MNELARTAQSLRDQARKLRTLALTLEVEAEYVDAAAKSARRREARLAPLNVEVLTLHREQQS